MSSNSERSLVARFAYVPKPDGPHARLGVVWFLAACLAAALGTVAVAVLFAAVVAVGSIQNMRAWKAPDSAANRLVAGSASAVIPIAALIGPIGLVLGVVVAVGLSLLAPLVTGMKPVLLLRSAIVPGLAAGAVVLTARIDMSAFVVLLVLVSAYEVGDYLMGADAGSVFEGPLSGMAAVVMVTFVETVFQLGPLETRAGWVFGAMVAVLAPLGAPLASALAPSAESTGAALRRIDAWILVAPLWCWALSNYMGQVG